jgi:lipopolysaccharide assembly protein A
MRYATRSILLLAVLAVGFWALLFTLANEATLSLDLVFAHLPETRASVLMLCAFIAGGLCGMLAGSGAIWRAMRSERALRRTLRTTQSPRAAPAPPAVLVVDQEADKA